MNIYTLTDLKFVAINGAIVAQKICSCCAKCKPMHGGYMAKLPVVADDYFPFYICSDACMSEFRAVKRQQQTNDYINECIRMAKQMHHIKV